MYQVLYKINDITYTAVDTVVGTHPYFACE